ncbi:MAG: hypothetical protein E6K99_01825 [Thaumarchaeota archaeon]|nr:MAG: hypothetical protein E6K86_01050 [Nitrososphaerota archaeon]TMQ00722.1 MAG: hypothetical protein E6K99_01825 [Nitrososphaerota archaeon]
MSSTDFVQWKTKFLSEVVGTFAISFFASAAIVVGFLLPGLDATGRLVFAALVPGCTLAFVRKTSPAQSVSKLERF